MPSLLLPQQKGSTPLFKASQDGHVSVVKLLLEAKAKPDVQNKVLYAGYREHLIIVEKGTR